MRNAFRLICFLAIGYITFLLLLPLTFGTVMAPSFATMGHETIDNIDNLISSNPKLNVIELSRDDARNISALNHYVLVRYRHHATKQLISVFFVLSLAIFGISNTNKKKA
jgi:hypothetical protein